VPGNLHRIPQRSSKTVGEHRCRVFAIDPVTLPELTELKRTGEVVDQLLADNALFHLEADLRWIDITAARLDGLRTAVQST